MQLETELLFWIAKESARLEQQGQPPVVPIHFLLVKVALATRPETQDITASTELSLQIYDRAAVYRHLRTFFNSGFIEFVERDGTPTKTSEKELAEAASAGKSRLNFIVLTNKGKEILR